MKVLNFYPGHSIWYKRVVYMLVASSIGLNLFINDVQNHLMVVTQSLVSKVDTLLPAAVAVADPLTYTVPVLKRIESSSAGRVLQKYGLPESKDIEAKINTVYELENICRAWDTNLRMVLQILRYASYLMWLPICSAVLWLCMDVRKGQAKIFTLN